MWSNLVEKLENPKNEVTIGMVGKYVELTESYKSLIEALRHASIHTSTKVNIEYIDSEADRRRKASRASSISTPCSCRVASARRGTEGKIKAIRYARESKTPYLGICLGMQLAVIEFARDVVGLNDANSTEFDSGHAEPGGRADHRVVRPRGPRREAHRRIGSGRHDAPRFAEVPDQAGHDGRAIYGTDVNERHRHRYEVNNRFVPQLEAGGLIISARTPSEDLPEMMELPRSDAPVVRRRAVPPGIHVHAA